MKKLNKAIIFAVNKHQDQVRKGTNIPYIVHPLEVMNILIRMNCNLDVIIAGILHDTLEDTQTLPIEIEKEFGSNVFNLVMKHSEDKSMSWKDRKQKTIDELKECEQNHKLFVFADKLSNLRSMVADYIVEKEKLWRRFNASKTDQAWYYGDVLKNCSDLEKDSFTRNYYLEAVNLYQKLFD